MNTYSKEMEYLLKDINEDLNYIKTTENMPIEELIYHSGRLNKNTKEYLQCVKDNQLNK